jgi:hypothetical protein
MPEFITKTSVGETIVKSTKKIVRRGFASGTKIITFDMVLKQCGGERGIKRKCKERESAHNFMVETMNFMEEQYKIMGYDNITLVNVVEIMEGVEMIYNNKRDGEHIR